MYTNTHGGVISAGKNGRCLTDLKKEKIVTAGGNRKPYTSIKQKHRTSKKQHIEVARICLKPQVVVTGSECEQLKQQLNYGCFSSYFLISHQIIEHNLLHCKHNVSLSLTQGTTRKQKM